MDTSNQVALVMNPLIKFPRLLLRITLLLCITLSTSHSAPAPLTFSIDFSAYALRPVDPSDIYFQNANGTLTLIQFTPKSRSRNYTATLKYDNQTLPFYRKKLTTDGPVIQKIGQVSLSPSHSKVLLIFLQAESSNDVTVYPIEDSAEIFPTGSLRVINITKADIIGQVDDSRVDLQHKQASKPIQLTGKESAVVSIAAKGEERFHLLYKNQIRIRPGCRGILILRPPARKGSLRIGGHLLLDTPNETKNEAPPET